MLRARRPITPLQTRAHRRAACVAMLLAMTAPATCWGHFFVVEADRVGASPSEPGSGWFAEVFLDIPEENAGQLLVAEQYVAGRTPDFKFRTPWIDFPAGPDEDAGSSNLDANFATLGDFLDDYIFDVSDPALLDAPFGNFLIRFHGLVDVRLNDSTSGDPRPPVLLDFATVGYDGYRTRIGNTTVYRVPNTQFVGGEPFYTENALVLAMGLYPIQVTYFQRYDPTGQYGNERAGIELYSWHGGGLPWLSGPEYILPGFGPLTVTPPRVIYQPDEIPRQPWGDADQDGDVDLQDAQRFQICFSGTALPPDRGLDPACTRLDFDGDADVDEDDYVYFSPMLAGPAEYAYLKGDYNSDRVIDLSDYRWFQVCRSIDSEESSTVASDRSSTFASDEFSTVAPDEFGTFGADESGKVGSDRSSTFASAEFSTVGSATFNAVDSDEFSTVGSDEANTIGSRKSDLRGGLGLGCQVFDFDTDGDVDLDDFDRLAPLLNAPVPNQ